MKCQVLFSAKNWKNTINLSSVEFAHSMLSIKLHFLVFLENKI